MNDQTTLTSEVARAFRDHGITAALTALIGSTMALIAAITRKALTNEDPLNGYAGFAFDAEVFAEKTRVKTPRVAKSGWSSMVQAGRASRNWRIS